jgi:hypothetical protein
MHHGDQQVPYTIHSTVKELLANAEARAIVERHLPGATSHPMLYEGMYMTLGEVASYPEAGLSQQKLQALLADLAKIQN